MLDWNVEQKDRSGCVVMADLFDNLNEKQKEAVLETEGYVRVIAGAGSGKTKLLVSRYAYLVQDYGIDSSNILCVTFTNKAAGEMKKRIRALIGEEDEVSLICTYHGFCNRLLRENPEKLFLSKQFQIIDNHQQKAMLGEIYQKYELKLDHASFESILKKIGYIKKDTEYVTRLCDPSSCQILDEIKNQRGFSSEAEGDIFIRFSRFDFVCNLSFGDGFRSTGEMAEPVELYHGGRVSGQLFCGNAVGRDTVWPIS